MLLLAKVWILITAINNSFYTGSAIYYVNNIWYINLGYKSDFQQDMWKSIVDISDY